MFLCFTSPSTAYLLLVQRDKEAGLVNLAGSPLPRRMSCDKPQHATVVEAFCIRGAFVCCRSQLAEWYHSSGGLLPERRMTHLPRGCESLHHHHSLLALEQMRFHSYRALSKKQGCFTNWTVNHYKSPGMYNLPLLWKSLPSYPQQPGGLFFKVCQNLV